MSRQKIAVIESSAALRLSDEILEALGVSVGDEVELSLEDKALVIRSLAEAERAERIASLTDELLDRRSDAYEELARRPE